MSGEPHPDRTAAPTEGPPHAHPHSHTRRRTRRHPADCCLRLRRQRLDRRPRHDRHGDHRRRHHAGDDLRHDDRRPPKLPATTPRRPRRRAQDVEADTAAAEGALLTLADFPDGWTEAPSEASTDVEDRLAECIGVDSLTSADASAGSSEFASPDGNLVVVESVGVNATERDARFVLAGITDPQVPECVAAAYTELGAAALGRCGRRRHGDRRGHCEPTRCRLGRRCDTGHPCRDPAR